MKKIETARVIRLIKLILDIVWYGALCAICMAAGLRLAMGNDLRSYYCHVVLEKTVTDSTICAVDSKLPLIALEHYAPIEADGEMFIRAPNTTFAVAFNSIALLNATFWLAVIFLLRKLFTALKDASPFTRANTMRVRAIGLFIFLGQFVISLLRWGLHHYLNSLVVTHGVHIRTAYQQSPQVLFLGLILIALAELFRHGVKLEEEQALTI